MSQGEFWPKQEEIIQGDQDGLQKRKNKKRVITNPSQQTGHWSESEHQTYIDFLNMHRSVMESQDQKKTSKIFKLMSETIGTRSPSQCRSHHQKFNPFVHQIKKRQKGAGRRKKENQNKDKMNKNDENAFLQSLQIQHQLFQQQPLEYQMFQFPYFPCVPVFDNQLKEDEKLNEQQQLYFQQCMLFQQQLPQQLDEKNICCFNFNFMPQQQLHLNFNYFQQQQQQMFNNDFQALNSGDINNKENQFDEQ
ncbi:unnamed protein product [Paramecium pentaurelia]|uniref:Myb-like domain-containing protein n=1 Tax=Paramecium pentaurelia TaxID=43138 RepID=A0A8S1VE35_9CILI|nr:unnamed protein product [Paramecium pentaurelia]